MKSDQLRQIHFRIVIFFILLCIPSLHKQIYYQLYPQERSLYCKVWFEDNSDPMIINATGESRSNEIMEIYGVSRSATVVDTLALLLLFHQLWTGGESEGKNPSSCVTRGDTMPATN